MMDKIGKYQAASRVRSLPDIHGSIPVRHTAGYLRLLMGYHEHGVHHDIAPKLQVLHPLDLRINPARSKTLLTESDNSSKVAILDVFRAIKTDSNPVLRSGNCVSQMALKRRRTWFRSTAPPTDLPVIMAIRCAFSVDLCTINTTSGWAYDLPTRRTRLISLDRVRRNLRFTHLPYILNFNTVFNCFVIHQMLDKTCLIPLYQRIRFT
jgi:hypothetical protein